MLIRRLAAFSTFVLCSLMALADAPTTSELDAAMEREDYTSVESMCREVLREDQDNARAWFLLGYALHVQGELDEAIFAHAAASRFEDTKMLATYNLACAHALKGNTDQAFEMLERAINLGMRDASVIMFDPDLTPLHDDPRWEAHLKLIETMNNMGAVAAARIEQMQDTQDEPDPAATALHFWVGEWDCYRASDGGLAGRNTLSERVGGLVIHESWTSDRSAYTGESWNHFDPRVGKWKQTWIGSRDGDMDIVELEARPSDEHEGLMFEGRSFASYEDTGTKKVRMHVRPVHDGWVRQTGMEWNRETESWDTTYDLIYVPKGEDFDPEALGI
jgi:hypothetical protein